MSNQVSQSGTHKNITIDNQKLIFKKGPKNKKYSVLFPDGKIVTFGDKRYQHYRDRIGLWSNLDHNNKTRRENYRKRHEAVKLKDGRIAKNVKFTPAWFSWNFLW